MSRSLGRAFDGTERAALAALHEAASVPLRRTLGLELDEIDGTTVSVAAGIPSVVINRTIGLGVERPATEADVSSIAARYEAAGAGRHLVHVDPAAEPDELGEWLEAAGYAPHRGWAQFARRAEEPPPRSRSDLEVRRIGAENARDFAVIVAAGFDLTQAANPVLARLVHRPDWHLYMTFDGETPTGAAGLFVHQDHAWCDWAATHPAHRRRGSQHALLCRRIQDAIELGCRWLFTETGESIPGDPQHSYRNIERVGFERFAVRENYAFDRARRTAILS